MPSPSSRGRAISSSTWWPPSSTTSSLSNGLHRNRSRRAGALDRAPSTSHVRVPGQHPPHYAPLARVGPGRAGEGRCRGRARARAWAQGRRLCAGLLRRRCGEAHAVVTVPGSMDSYAHGLYGILRELDQHV
ncbi:Sua5 family C-terminal domain-containing protein [Streptomyces sp. NPDC058623]|uniref:Sua5 family C-terminal domain-containing protein n=1 Tax=Streptomyces sp. NPDC058623 TaxID=3346563 RepID=UPI00364848B7